MSRPKNEPPRLKWNPPGESPDDATPVGSMTLSGLVRTTKGFAVAVATFKADGGLTVRLGPSQTDRPSVAREHKRLLPGLANGA